MPAISHLPRLPQPCSLIQSSEASGINAVGSGGTRCSDANFWPPWARQRQPRPSFAGRHASPTSCLCFRTTSATLTSAAMAPATSARPTWMAWPPTASALATAIPMARSAPPPASPSSPDGISSASARRWNGRWCPPTTTSPDCTRATPSCLPCSSLWATSLPWWASGMWVPCPLPSQAAWFR